jgi:hypothetical protein
MRRTGSLDLLQRFFTVVWNLQAVATAEKIGDPEHVFLLPRERFLDHYKTIIKKKYIQKQLLKKNDTLYSSQEKWRCTRRRAGLGWARKRKEFCQEYSIAL